MALTAKQIFEEKIALKLKDNPAAAQAVNAIYEFKVSGDPQETWTLDLTKPGGEVKEGSSGAAKCTVSISVADLGDIIEKKLNPQMAFMTGKLKVTGDMGLALKLGTVL